MNIAQIEENLQRLNDSFTEDNFIYDLLLAYDIPKSNIKRLKEGSLNISKIEDEILWKKKLLFKKIDGQDLHSVIDDLKHDQRVTTHAPRFIIVTDFKNLLSIDTKTQDSLDIPIADIPKHYDFFLPLAGMEKAQYKSENPADVKAAEKMAKLYDEITRDNQSASKEQVHSLNVFLSRLLFCFFAEDTEIFAKHQFTNAVGSHTQADGSDLKEYLEKLFLVLNTDYTNRKDLPKYLNDFPYVNGGLFRDSFDIPVFTRKSRLAILECGSLNWKDINPDIFGSMIQAVITPEHRGGLGMHYTSVPNIMKVIGPLFLDELYEDFETNKHHPQKLNNLLYRLSKLKIFDPACGSGNFLIIAYKELRVLEIRILQQLEKLQHYTSGFEEKQLALIPKSQQSLAAMHQRQLFSNIQLTQFYGIEIDDFAHEIAILSLWLAQHQMNMMFKEMLGQGNPTLPLKESGHITHGNATRVNWDIVCPPKDGDEIYILGNPPYSGARFQSVEQKEDLQLVFKGIKGHNSLDYICCWFYKGAEYIKSINGKLAFVSTNSVCQGEQVSLLWPSIFTSNVNICFGHTAFKWSNNAKNKAVVAVIIVGLAPNFIKRKKYLFIDNIKKEVENISPYLTGNKNVIVRKRQLPFKDVPKLVYGNQAIDGGNLILSQNEVDDLLKVNPEAKQYIKRLYGAQDFMNDNTRYCIWVKEKDFKTATHIPFFAQRFEKVKEFRMISGEVARDLVDIPYRFRYVHEAQKSLLIIPRTTSVRRKYLPVGYKDHNVIVTDSIQVIYDSEPYIMGFLSSNIHMLWVKAVAGGIKTDIGYSNSLCYNSFPFPDLNRIQKAELEKHVFRIIEERENYSERTLAQLYDPLKMPDGLQEAHHQLDLAVERCYRSKPFDNDEERLEYLFKLYEQMTQEEKSKPTVNPKEICQI
ncbi:MAG: class I SAM-dependent DNA methyltransferase [Sphingobacteriaceae bacterium]|nr:MAG: class I SAM-dependent DNA methyltransferase [Sphingobacteriaceae bacterium]